MRKVDSYRLLACAISTAYAIVYFLLLEAKWRTFDPAMLDAASLAWMMGDLIDVSGVSGYWWRGIVWIIQPLTFLWIVPLWIAKSPVVLLAHGPLWIAAAGVLAFGLGRRMTGSNAMGLACQLLVLLNPYASLATLAGVVPGNEGPAIVLAMVLFRATGRIKPFTVAAIMLAMARIDFVPALLLWGAWMRWREKDRPFGRRTLLVGGATLAAIAIFSILLASPGARDALVDLDLAAFGDRAGEAAAHVAIDPSALLANVISADNLRHLLLLACLLFLPLLSPGLLVPTLISLALILVTTPLVLSEPSLSALTHDDRSIISLWHSSYRVLLPFLCAAAVAGAARLHGLMSKRIGSSAGPLLAGGIIVSSLLVHIFLTPSFFGPAPLTPEFNLNAYADRPRARLGWEMLSRVPEDEQALMSDTFYFRAWRHGKRQLLFSGQDELTFTKWALIDLYAPAVYLSRRDLYDRTIGLLESGVYGVSRFEDGYILMRRGEDQTLNHGILRFMMAEKGSLLRNLEWPYRHGSRPGPLYSPTQRADRDSGN